MNYKYLLVSALPLAQINMLMFFFFRQRPDILGGVRAGENRWKQEARSVGESLNNRCMWRRRHVFTFRCVSHSPSAHTAVLKTLTLVSLPTCIYFVSVSGRLFHSVRFSEDTPRGSGHSRNGANTILNLFLFVCGWKRCATNNIMLY